MGYIRGFVHGTVAGTVIGLCIAPQTGDKTRAQLKAASAAGDREGVATTSRALRRVAPVAGSAIQAVEHLRHRGDTALEGNGRVSAPSSPRREY